MRSGERGIPEALGADMIGNFTEPVELTYVRSGVARLE